MKYDLVKHNRQSYRLKGYDYSSSGNYFVTVMVMDRECLFGKIRNGDVELSEIGKIADQCWQEIPEHFPNVKLDEYIIMPNHVHGIIEIINNGGNLQRSGNAEFKSPSKTIGSIIRGFKIGVTKWCRNEMADGFPSFRQIWQRNYHDHIIRNDHELNRIRQYIVDNPLNWKRDRNDP